MDGRCKHTDFTREAGEVGVACRVLEGMEGGLGAWPCPAWDAGSQERSRQRHDLV